MQYYQDVMPLAAPDKFNWFALKNYVTYKMGSNFEYWIDAFGW